jgi:phosphoglycolate phosphatase
MTRITVACLDMAGTTVADDGTVLEAFASAIAGLPEAAFDRAMTDVRSSMGQSKIEVFRRILGDEAAASRANEAFEDLLRHGRPSRPGLGHAGRGGHAHPAPRGRRPGLPGHRLLPRHQGRHRRQARLGRADRPGPVPRRRRARALVARPAADRAAPAARRAVGELAVVGDTASDIESGRRAGAAIVAGVLTGASTRTDLERADAPLILDTIADILPHIDSVTG